jgi:hypothetical protein
MLHDVVPLECREVRGVQPYCEQAGVERCDRWVWVCLGIGPVLVHAFERAGDLDRERVLDA